MTSISNIQLRRTAMECDRSQSSFLTWHQETIARITENTEGTTRHCLRATFPWLGMVREVGRMGEAVDNRRKRAGGSKFSFIFIFSKIHPGVRNDLNARFLQPTYTFCWQPPSPLVVIKGMKMTTCYVNTYPN
jgi:hypothetical protein